MPEITSLSPNPVTGGPGKSYEISVHGKHLFQYGVNGVLADGKALLLTHWSDNLMKVLFDTDWLTTGQEMVTEEVGFRVRYQPICNGSYSPESAVSSDSEHLVVNFPAQQVTPTPPPPTKTKHTFTAFADKKAPVPVGKIYYVLTVNIPGAT